MSSDIKKFEEISTIKYPSNSYGSNLITGFKRNGDEALAIYKGKIIKSKFPLVRIHSQCIFGEVFGSLRCDCHPQLEKALDEITHNPPGLLIYLFQEGRGAGLINKLRAIRLEDQGMDTVEAYEALHLPLDQREYKMAARILEYFRIDSIKLLTNNPRKVEGIKEYGIKVKRVPLEIKPNKYNKAYLATKKNKMGHILENI